MSCAVRICLIFILNTSTFAIIYGFGFFQSELIGNGAISFLWFSISFVVCAVIYYMSLRDIEWLFVNKLILYVYALFISFVTVVLGACITFNVYGA